MSKALEAKHDKILKGLLRQPDNKRCINCETLVRESCVRWLSCHPEHPAASLTDQPFVELSRDHNMQWQICKFSYVQCAAEFSKPECYNKSCCLNSWLRRCSQQCLFCSRQFSHRVKGLSTSTFKPEEIKALEAGGNRVRPACQALLAFTFAGTTYALDCRLLRTHTLPNGALQSWQSQRTGSYQHRLTQ